MTEQLRILPFEALPQRFNPEDLVPGTRFEGIANVAQLDSLVGRFRRPLLRRAEIDFPVKADFKLPKPGTKAFTELQDECRMLRFNGRFEDFAVTIVDPDTKLVNRAHIARIRENQMLTFILEARMRVTGKPQAEDPAMRLYSMYTTAQPGTFESNPQLFLKSRSLNSKKAVKNLLRASRFNAALGNIYAAHRMIMNPNGQARGGKGRR